MGSWTLHIVAQDFLSLCQVLSRAVVFILSPCKLTLFSFEFYQFSYTAFIFQLDSKDTGKLLTVNCVTVVHFNDANLWRRLTAFETDTTRCPCSWLRKMFFSELTFQIFAFFVIVPFGFFPFRFWSNFCVIGNRLYRIYYGRGTLRSPPVS